MKRAADTSMFLWRGSALVIGPGINSTPHAHFAAQLTLGLERPFRARLWSDLPWIETDAAVFAPNQTHQIDGDGGPLAHLFVELAPRRLTDVTRLDVDYHAAPAFLMIKAALDKAGGGRLDIDQAERIAHDWLQCALPDAFLPSSFDPRITSTLEWIAAHPDARASGALLASRAHLSESRFTHLFRYQTGLSLSRYLLWTRLLNGVEAVARGDNMTNAAHAAGFADLAHMSRSFRNTFGVVPSALQKMTIAFKREAL